MKTYQCHKQVKAAQILRVVDTSPQRNTVDVYLKDSTCELMSVDRKVFDRHKPEPGDYLVEYDGGYLSVSPKQAFEDGYAQISTGPVAEYLEHPLERFFEYDHLPDHLRTVSKPFSLLVSGMCATLPDSTEKSAGMRKLLEAKDCFVRAALPVS